MSIEEGQPPKASRGYAMRNIMHHSVEGGVGKGDRAGEAEVFVAFAIIEHRQRPHRNVIGQLRQGSIQTVLGNEGIGEQRQMITVLFHRAHGQHDDALALVQCGDLGPGEVGKLAGDWRLGSGDWRSGHGWDSSNTSKWPGLSSPWGSQRARASRMG